MKNKKWIVGLVVSLIFLASLGSFFWVQTQRVAEAKAWLASWNKNGLMRDDPGVDLISSDQVSGSRPIPISLLFGGGSLHIDANSEMSLRILGETKLNPRPEDLWWEGSTRDYEVFVDKHARARAVYGVLGFLRSHNTGFNLMLRDQVDVPTPLSASAESVWLSQNRNSNVFREEMTKLAQGHAFLCSALASEAEALPFAAPDQVLQLMQNDLPGILDRCGVLSDVKATVSYLAYANLVGPKKDIFVQALYMTDEMIASLNREGSFEEAMLAR